MASVFNMIRKSLSTESKNTSSGDTDDLSISEHESDHVSDSDLSGVKVVHQRKKGKRHHSAENPNQPETGSQEQKRSKLARQERETDDNSTTADNTVSQLKHRNGASSYSSSWSWSSIT